MPAEVLGYLLVDRRARAYSHDPDHAPNTINRVNHAEAAHSEPEITGKLAVQRLSAAWIILNGTKGLSYAALNSWRQVADCFSRDG
jgi:hypothetical protein